MAQQQLTVDCGSGDVTTAPLTADQQAAYDAAQTAAAAALPAQLAALAMYDQHRQALEAIRASLGANVAITTNDITAVQNLVATLQAGTPPNQAQLLQLVRFLLRALAVLQG